MTYSVGPTPFKWAIYNQRTNKLSRLDPNSLYPVCVVSIC